MAGRRMGKRVVTVPLATLFAVAPRTAGAVPRGRHAPPLEVRQDRQRARLFAAASAVFARVGYADASAEAIAREAGMSKATFYEHFDNKEDCIVALFDAGALAVVEAMRRAGAEAEKARPAGRVMAIVHTFLEALAAFPDEAQTLLVDPAEERLAVREERARPLVLELEAWLRAQHERVSRKSETGKAIGEAR